MKTIIITLLNLIIPFVIFSSNKGCISIISNTLMVYEKPIPQFTDNEIVECPIHCVDFTDTSTVQAPSQITN